MDILRLTLWLLAGSRCLFTKWASLDQKGYFYLRACHCERRADVLLTVIHPNIFSLYSMDGEGEVKARATSLEPGWGSWGPGRSSKDEQPGSLLGFLLVPSHGGTYLHAAFTCYGDKASLRCCQCLWRLGRCDLSPAACKDTPPRQHKVLLFSKAQRKHFL